MPKSTDVKLSQAQKDRVDSVFNGAGVDPNIYHGWFSQQGTEWFFIPEGILQASEGNAVPAVAALIESVAGPG